MPIRVIITVYEHPTGVISVRKDSPDDNFTTYENVKRCVSENRKDTAIAESRLVKVELIDDSGFRDEFTDIRLKDISAATA